MSPDTHALSPPLERALHTNVDDHSLIGVSVEQPEVFGELFERHARELHRFLSRRLGDLADDLLGELFVTAFERRASYRAELADARPWLYGAGARVDPHPAKEPPQVSALAVVGKQSWLGPARAWRWCSSRLLTQLQETCVAG